MSTVSSLGSYGSEFQIFQQWRTSQCGLSWQATTEICSMCQCLTARVNGCCYFLCYSLKSLIHNTLSDISSSLRTDHLQFLQILLTSLRCSPSRCHSWTVYVFQFFYHFPRNVSMFAMGFWCLLQYCALYNSLQCFCYCSVLFLHSFNISISFQSNWASYSYNCRGILTAIV